MEIETFVKKWIEGHLFSDLERMSVAQVDETTQAGGCDYPMLMTICAAIELLGGLLQGSRFDTKAESAYRYFHDYWENYLADFNPIYKEYSAQIYPLLRQGLAHPFIADESIKVIKEAGDLHFKLQNTSDSPRLFYIGTNNLYRDLRGSFETFFQPELTDNHDIRQRLQAGLEKMFLSYGRTKHRQRIEAMAMFAPQTEPAFGVAMAG